MRTVREFLRALLVSINIRLLSAESKSHEYINRVAKKEQLDYYLILYIYIGE